MYMEAIRFMVRPMTKEDYKEVYDLWIRISGLGIRSIDDSEAGVHKFLDRNPGFSVVDVEEGKIVGAILSGHDGRRGCLYHVCVDEAWRNRGIARNMVTAALAALKEEGINKINIIAFRNNRLGNGFWTKLGWTMRQDVNYYEFNLNENNVTEFVK